MAKAAVQDTVVGTVSRQRREEIRVAVRHYQGKRILDIRVFVETKLGTMIPTARGVSLLPEQWKELRSILQRLHQEKEGRSEGGASDRPKD